MIWFFSTDPAILRYLPTSYVLHVHGSDSTLAIDAAEELGRRYQAGALTPDQCGQFLRQGVRVNWEAHARAGHILFLDGLNSWTTVKSHLDVWCFPVDLLGPLIDFEQVVVSLHIDGELLQWPSLEDRGLAELANYVTVDEVTKLTVFASDFAANLSIRSFFVDIGANPSPRVAKVVGPTGLTLRSRASGSHVIKIDSVIVARDVGSRSIIAAWVDSASLVAEFNSPPPLIIKTQTIWIGGFPDSGKAASWHGAIIIDDNN
ncbi:MAG: hypothetical protein IID36_01555 [Planctomycetes bacterium]|nr:hypothetical protein [Planctomycetota bacterium]